MLLSMSESVFRWDSWGDIKRCFRKGGNVFQGFTEIDK